MTTAGQARFISESSDRWSAGADGAIACGGPRRGALNVLEAERRPRPALVPERVGERGDGSVLGEEPLLDEPVPASIRFGPAILESGDKEAVLGARHRDVEETAELPILELVGNLLRGARDRRVAFLVGAPEEE